MKSIRSAEKSQRWGTFSRIMTNSPKTQVKVYRAEDAPPRALAGEVVAVLGYGNLGRTAALNLRDSGLKVRVGNQEDEYAERGRSEGFEVVPLALAASDDVVFVLLPDEVIPEVFEREIAPALRPGSAVAFGSGYSLAFDLIQPPPSVDVLLVAPRMGTVSTCLTGPVNAVISSAGERSRQYTAGIGVGILAIGFGLLSPTVTRLMLATPRAFISALAGLAMLRVLQAAFSVAFAERYTLGALLAFIVTVSDVTILNIGAPFWGLVFGFATSWLLERGDQEQARG